MATKSEEEASKTAYNLFIAPRPYSFNLSEEMLKLLREEFDPPVVIQRVAQEAAGKEAGEIDAAAEKIFRDYGDQLMRKTLQLGDEYSDRTYEVLREAADQTGEMVFPLVLQRFIEIAYLSTQAFRLLPIVENWSKRLVFKVTDCYMFKTLQSQIGPEVADRLPCRHACLTLCRSGLQGLGLDGSVEMEANMAKDGYCQFAINRI
jgi:hypothetical protein